MSFNTNITVGRPPLLWSDVQEAFTQVNENFDILAATIGTGSGLSPIDFTTLDTSVKPTTDNLYDLGDATHRWKSVFTGEYGVADLLNGVWAGSAQIKGVGTTVNLPNGSTVGGDPLTGVGASLIIDPDKTFFKEIQVDNASSVVATTFADTFNLFSGTGINLTVSSGADSITVANSGIISVSAGNGINTSTASGVATISNTGVRSIDNISGLPTGRTQGAGINVSASTGDNVRITNTGVISVSSGVGITVSLDAATGDVTITNSLPAGNTFAQVEVNGDSANRLIADAASDVLNITSGQGISLSKTVANDTLNIAVNPVFDLKGSVFGDDSSILVDAVSNYIYGNVSATTLRTQDNSIILGQAADAGNYSVSIGYEAGLNTPGDASVAIGVTAGRTNQSNNAVAIGRDSAYNGQGDSAVAIGFEAGNNNQGIRAVAIGYRAGYNNQTSGSIVINASGVAINGSAAGFYVDPVRSTTSSARPVVYDATTKELFYTSTLEFVNSTISTSDSSGITVDVQTTFNTDVIIENDLTVAETLTLKGSRVLNLAQIKNLVAASSSFADFQTKIAALV